MQTNTVASSDFSEPNFDEIMRMGASQAEVVEAPAVDLTQKVTLSLGEIQALVLQGIQQAKGTKKAEAKAPKKSSEQNKDDRLGKIAAIAKESGKTPEEVLAATKDAYKLHKGKPNYKDLYNTRFRELIGVNWF
jgi:2-iminoacetate synthase ThiH